MWVKNSERRPPRDGEYLIQTVFGRLSEMGFTVEYGWNTLSSNESGIPDEYVHQWFDGDKSTELTAPGVVPDESLEAYMTYMEEGNDVQSRNQ